MFLIFSATIKYATFLRENPPDPYSDFEFCPWQVSARVAAEGVDRRGGDPVHQIAWEQDNARHIQVIIAGLRIRLLVKEPDPGLNASNHGRFFWHLLNEKNCLTL